jgi:mannose-6-phosphate isomerase-like protein (cupin superfamily)
MIHTGKESALAWHRDGLSSFVLLHAGDGNDAPITVTWVDAAPGQTLPAHHHEYVQAYIVTAGAARMEVDGEQRDMCPGDLVYMPSGAVHAITNVGDEPLSLLTVAYPAYELYRDEETKALRARF